MIEWFQMLQAAILHLTGSPWALVVLGLLTFGDGFVPPLPSGTYVSALGATSATQGGAARILVIVAIATVGALLGDLMMYAIGRLFHPRPTGRIGALVGQFRLRLDRHWPLVLSTARFIPVVRVAVFLAAGLARFRLDRVILMDGMAATVWACVYTFSGRLGGTISSQPLIGVLIGMCIGALAGLAISRIAQWLQKRRASDAVPAPGTEDPRS